jgi:hypothetical protein
VLKRASEYYGDSNVEVGPANIETYLDQESEIGAIIGFSKPKTVLRNAPAQDSSPVSGTTGPLRCQLIEGIKYESVELAATGTWFLMEASGSVAGWIRASDLQSFVGPAPYSPISDNWACLRSEKDLLSGVRVNMERYAIFVRRCPIFGTPGFAANKGNTPIATVNVGVYVETVLARHVIESNIIERWYSFEVPDGSGRDGWVEIGYITFDEDKMDRDAYVKMLKEDGWYDIGDRTQVSQGDSAAITRIVCDSTLSAEQKQSKLRVYQDSLGTEVLAAFIRSVPVYDTDKKEFSSFDSYVRNLAGASSIDVSSTPFERDPVGASIRIFMDPSESTISEMLGLGDW